MPIRASLKYGLLFCGILALLPALGASLPAWAATGGDWASFRGDARLTGVASQPLPGDLILNHMPERPP